MGTKSKALERKPGEWNATPSLTLDLVPEMSICLPTTPQYRLPRSRHFIENFLFQVPMALQVKVLSAHHASNLVLATCTVSFSAKICFIFLLMCRLFSCTCSLFSGKQLISLRVSLGSMDWKTTLNVYSLWRDDISVHFVEDFWGAFTILYPNDQLPKWMSTP